MGTWIRRQTGGVALAAGLLAVDGATPAATLQPATVASWNRYVDATERRRAGERDPARFLAMDYESGAAADRRALLQGEIVVRRMRSVTPQGGAIPIEGGLVHHWRGTVFIPNVTVDRLMSGLRNAPPAQEDVLHARVLERGADRMRVFLKLRRSKIVTVVYNTEHTVTFRRVDERRSASESTATRIAEVEGFGTSKESERPPGDDRGFLWRLNAYWRYEAANGGVIAECESLTLSRGIPFGLGVFVGSMVEGTARESMDRTLNAVRTEFANRAPQTSRASSPAR